MNKKIIVIMAVLLSVLLCACKDVPDPADTILDMHENEDKAQDALDAYKQGDVNIDEVGAEILGENTQPLEEEAKPEEYVFNYKGVNMKVDQEFGSILAIIGEPANYYEAKSCAFEGKDKVYSYGSVDISTYPQGDKDFISYIDFRDDTVTTKEGAYLFMSKADVLSLYGDNYTEKLGAYCYRSGSSELRFIFQDDAVVSIQYATLVLNEE